MAISKLECMVCPRQGSFSDVSHLLTHLSSKAHLAHQFKLQVRSYKHDDAADLLEAFNQWYDANGIAKMLSDRAASKIGRTSKRKSDDTTSTPSVSSGTAETSLPSNATSDHLKAPPGSPNNFDRFFADHCPAGETSITTHQNSLMPASSKSACIANGLSNCPSQADSNLHPMTDDKDNARSMALPENNTLFPVTPTRPPRKERKKHSNQPNFENNPFVVSQVQRRKADKENVVVVRDEIVRLKGALWPGMDVFDAATLAMRKLRNQKKDGSALKQMEMTSRLVEPTEQIYSYEGALLKERVITGDIEDDSPLEGESPIPIKPPRFKPVILRDNDPNVHMDRYRKRPKPDAHRTASSKTRATPQPAIFNYTKGSFGSALTGDSAGDSDLTLSTAAIHGARARTGFAVYRDNKDQTTRGIMREDHLTDFHTVGGTLTPARLIRDHKLNTYTDEHSIQSPDKRANQDPLLGMGARIDSPLWNPVDACWRNHDPNITDYMESSFFESDAVSGFGNVALESRGRDGDHDHFPPAPAFKLTSFHRQSFNEETIDNAGWAGLSPAGSSQATISEAGTRDLSQVYLTTHATD